MSALPTAILWLVAGASVALLLGAGYVFAAARLKARLESSRQQAVALQGKVAATREDPFGELKVLSEQLQRIRQRLERLGAGTGQVAASELADSKTLPPPEPAVFPAPERPPATSELEAKLELVRREVYAKTRRIEELEAEKQRLAERVVGLEEGAKSPGPDAPAPKRPAFLPVNTVEGPASRDGLASLIDTLQQEADGLRAELAEREERIRILERSDSTGIVHELERIRRELQTRTEELAAAQDRLSLAEKASAQARAKAASAVEEKEAMASRSLEASAELRRAQEKVRDLERQMESRASGPGASGPGALGAGMAPATWPAIPPTTSPGRPLPPAEKTPSRPAAVPRLTPPTGQQAALRPTSPAVPALTPPSGEHPAARHTLLGGPPLTPPSGELPALRPTARAVPALTPPSGQQAASRPTSPAVPALTPPSGEHPAARHTLLGGPGLTPPTGRHPAARPFGSPALAPAAEAAPRRPDPFDVNTLPSAPPDLFSAPPDLFDVHTKPTATHPALPPPRRGGSGPAPSGSGPPSGAGAPSATSDPAEPATAPPTLKDSGRIARPRRPTGSIFPEPTSRSGPDSK